MRKPAKSLTARQVQALRDPGKYFDSHGLYLFIGRDGSRRWVQRIMVGGKRREIGLGPVSLVTLLEAREAALANRKLARAGGDPLQARRRGAGGADLRAGCPEGA